MLFTTKSTALQIDSDAAGHAHGRKLMPSAQEPHDVRFRSVIIVEPLVLFGPQGTVGGNHATWSWVHARRWMNSAVTLLTPTHCSRDRPGGLHRGAPGGAGGTGRRGRATARWVDGWEGGSRHRKQIHGCVHALLLKADDYLVEGPCGGRNNLPDSLVFRSCRRRVGTQTGGTRGLRRRSSRRTWERKE